MFPSSLFPRAMFPGAMFPALSAGVPGTVVDSLTYRVEFYLGGAWVDVTADIRTLDPIVCEYGILGSGPEDRVANAGSLTFLLDNTNRNSGGLVGYYSPLHANKRANFGFNIPVRFVLAFQELTRYKFHGSLADIVPSPGVNDLRIVSCQALDWMDDAAQIDMPDLPAQVNKRGDELATMILDAMTTQPVTRSIETGVETFAWSLDGGTGQRLKVRERLQQICMSEFGHCFIQGDSSQGGNFCFRNRHSRPASHSVSLTTLSSDEIVLGGLSVPGSRDELYRTVQVFVHPIKEDPVPTTVLYSIENSDTVIQPSESYGGLFGPYRDPIGSDQVGGTDMQTPAPYTDYTMNALQDGTGADLTGGFVVTASYTGEGVRFTIVNNSGTAGYVTSLQSRGKALRRVEVMLEDVIPGSYGDRVLTLDLPFHNDTNFGRSLAQYLTQVYATPLAHIPSVRFRANRSDSLMRVALIVEPGERVTVNEEVTGVNHEFYVNSVRLELEGTGQLWCTWGLEPASTSTYWIWGQALMGVSTVLGF